MIVMEQPQTDYLTPDYVAQDLGVAKSTVLQWLREGKLPGYQFAGRVWRIRRDQYKTWKENSSNQRSRE